MAVGTRALGRGAAAVDAAPRTGTDGFESFFSEHFHSTVGLVTLACGRPSLAEEVTQEAFARGLHRWESLQAMGRPDRWVLKVAMNLLVDHGRRLGRETVIEDAQPAPSHDGVQRLWVRWGLDRLTPMQRRAMVMRYIDGRPVAEVAELLARSTETVRTHIRLGRRRLRTLLAEEM
jgi:RNA polymerase sigma-70 factor (ECF subfamily)